MRVDRSDYPHVSAADLRVFVKSLKPMELKALADEIVDNLDEYKEAKILDNPAVQRQIEAKLEEVKETITKIEKALSGVK